ncbi:retropepsin-like aspartic protease [Sphingomonas paucimobilis]|uniref:Aspartyl protease n=2 Tax=Sphingomonas TaxID=13687 RepID=A0A7Y2KL72_SPHPI|nr:retropepsin-like aspartic protease [Sphingomonas paucimobilis]EPE61876.1 hypothetical protein L479_01732 [Exiguobacterium sp. S17]NNG56009.1 hypothetical protein [Sphingomonas paucimobilis]
MKIASMLVVLQIMSEPSAGSLNIPQKMVASNGIAITDESSDRLPRSTSYNIHADFAPDREYKSSSIEIKNGKIILDIKVNGKNTKAVLDTGSSATIIDNNLADRLGLRSSGNPLLIKKLGNIKTLKTSLSNMVLLDIPRQVNIKTNCVLMNLEDLSKIVGNDVGIVIGRDILMTSSIYINFDDNELIIKPSGYIEASHPAIKSFISDDGLINVRIGARRIDALVDTGYAGILKLNDNDLLSVKSSNSSLKMGASIKMTIDVAGITSEIPIDTNSKSNPTMTNSLLGLGFLRNVNLILDLSRHRMFLVPRKKLSF